MTTGHVTDRYFRTEVALREALGDATADLGRWLIEHKQTATWLDLTLELRTLTKSTVSLATAQNWHRAALERAAQPKAKRSQ